MQNKTAASWFQSCFVRFADEQPDRRWTGGSPAHGFVRISKESFSTVSSKTKPSLFAQFAGKKPQKLS